MKLILGFGLLGVLLIAAPAQAACSNIVNSYVCLDDYSEGDVTYYSFSYGVLDNTVAGYGWAYRDPNYIAQVETYSWAPTSTDTWLYLTDNSAWTGSTVADHGAWVSWYDADDDGLVDIGEVSTTVY